MSLSLIAVPVFLDTTQTAGQLYIQWARMYHYGHLVLPSLSVVTFLLYGYIAMEKRFACNNWRSYLLAGVTTFIMVPFTWIVMVPTNDTLFRLEAETRTGVLASSLDEAQALVMKWSIMHFARSLFPLAGVVLGSLATLQKSLF